MFKYINSFLCHLYLWEKSFRSKHVMWLNVIVEIGVFSPIVEVLVFFPHINTVRVHSNRYSFQNQKLLFFFVLGKLSFFSTSEYKSRLSLALFHILLNDEIKFTRIPLKWRLSILSEMFGRIYQISTNLFRVLNEHTSKIKICFHLRC